MKRKAPADEFLSELFGIAFGRFLGNPFRTADDLAKQLEMRRRGQSRIFRHDHARPFRQRSAVIEDHHAIVDGCR